MWEKCDPSRHIVIVSMKYDASVSDRLMKVRLALACRQPPRPAYTSRRLGMKVLARDAALHVYCDYYVEACKMDSTTLCT